MRALEATAERLHGTPWDLNMGLLPRLEAPL